jgi:hypothetical protein
MEDLEVSLVKYLCPVCGKEADEGIIMNSILTEVHDRGRHRRTYNNQPFWEKI